MSTYPDWLERDTSGPAVTLVNYAADHIAVFTLEAERLSFESVPGHLNFLCAPEVISFSVTGSQEFTVDATSTTAFRSTP